MQVPDYVTPIVGWRAWRVLETDDGPRLSSIVFSLLWQPRTEMRAVCQPFPSRGSAYLARHAAPRRSCNCGIYAGATLVEAEPYLDGYSHLGGGAPVVLGRVALWGTVVEAADGWRASHAYPHELFVLAPRGPRDAGEDLAAALTEYGVPVEILHCEPRRGHVAAILSRHAA
jgi:hypothetical protein